jgi:TldD protein
MTDNSLLHDLFFVRNHLDEGKAASLVTRALHGMDDGELFLEYTQSESLQYDDGRLKHSSFRTSQGFGLRAVSGEASGYAHASEISEAAIARAADTVRGVHSGDSGSVNFHAPFGTNRHLYESTNPLHAPGFEEKVTLLQQIDAYLRAKDPCVRQVSASLAANWQAVKIIRGDGLSTGDIRPLVRLTIQVVAERNGRLESGSASVGGREGYAKFIAETSWKQLADDALRQALVNLESVPAPAGEMLVVVGPGWPGVLLHEAVGHGLEGDFNRKGTSAFAGLVGERVAAPGVTVVDDGTFAGKRGSINIDDEGTPTSHTVLIEDGILKGYLQDRMNARLMGVPATGNGRRESFSHQPMPRMTNTYMLGGKEDPGNILASVKKGLYAVNFGGGQVDITSGKFVFSASEAYLIENGKITAPVKGATLIGNGPDALTRVRAIGNDLQLDAGYGTCGKAGQSVPVGVGQPTLLLEGMTVGGTEVG